MNAKILRETQKLILFFSLIHFLSADLLLSEESIDSHKNGILTKDMGSLALFNSQYVFPLRLYEDELLGHFAEIHLQFVKLYNAIFEKSQNNDTDPVMQLLLNELELWKHDYYHSLTVVKNLFRWSIPVHEPHRLKRGAFNGGGYLLKLLIGTATEDDVNLLDKSVNKLIATSKLHEMEINLHSHIINVTTTKINNIQAIQNKLEKVVTQLNANIDNLDNFTDVLQTDLYDSNAFASLILALLQINQKVSLIKKGITTMMSGVLAPEIVDTETLQEFLAVIKKKHFLLFDADDISLSFFYDTATVHSMYDHKSNSILFLVSFPINILYSQPFSLKEVSPILLESNIPNIFTQLDVPKYLAINANGNYFEKQDLLDCTKWQHVHICPLRKGLQTNQNNSCTLSKINNIKPSAAVCNTRLIKVQQPIFTLHDNYWYYASTVNFTLHIHCLDIYYESWTHVDNVTIMGTGRIKINHGCVASSEHIYLKATAKSIYSEARNVTFEQEPLPVKILEELNNKSIGKNINLTDLLINVGDNTNLDDLTSRLAILDNFKDRQNIESNVNKYLIYTSFFLSLLSICILFWIGFIIIQDWKETTYTINQDGEGTYQKREVKLDNKDSKKRNSLPKESPAINMVDIKEAYRKSNIYENDIERLREVNRKASEIYMNMEVSSDSEG